MKQKTMHLALWTCKFINMSVSGGYWRMVLHINIRYTPTLICPKLSIRFSFLPLQQHITIFQKYLDSDSDKTQVLASLGMNCIILGLQFSNVWVSSTAKFYVRECILPNILFKLQLLVHGYRNITPANSTEKYQTYVFLQPTIQSEQTRYTIKELSNITCSNKTKTVRSEVLTAVLLRSLLGCEAA